MITHILFAYNLFEFRGNSGELRFILVNSRDFEVWKQISCLSYLIQSSVFIRWMESAGGSTMKIRNRIFSSGCKDRQRRKETFNKHLLLYL